MHLTISLDGKYEQIQNLKIHFSFLLLCHNTLSSPIPTLLLFVLQKWIVYLPHDSHISLLFFDECLDTLIWLEMSVGMYLITLLLYSHTAHCSANLSGRLCAFSAWSWTISFNARSPIVPENYLLSQISACLEAF